MKRFCFWTRWRQFQRDIGRIRHSCRIMAWDKDLLFLFMNLGIKRQLSNCWPSRGLKVGIFTFLLPRKYSSWFRPAVTFVKNNYAPSTVMKTTFTGALLPTLISFVLIIGRSTNYNLQRLQYFVNHVSETFSLDYVFYKYYKCTLVRCKE